MPATQTFVSVEEYLSTMYHPDCDYVDGHIEERIGQQNLERRPEIPEDHRLRRIRIDGFE